jgi:acyl-CoA reductase-like NAD-dependent aldehyde dehydrogenase
MKSRAVWENCTNVFDPNLSFGGFKESGWGRELGLEGVEAFTELRLRQVVRSLLTPSPVSWRMVAAMD